MLSQLLVSIYLLISCFLYRWVAEYFERFQLLPHQLFLMAPNPAFLILMLCSPFPQLPTGCCYFLLYYSYILICIDRVIMPWPINEALLVVWGQECLFGFVCCGYCSKSHHFYPSFLFYFPFTYFITTFTLVAILLFLCRWMKMPNWALVTLEQITKSNESLSRVSQ